MKYTITPVLFAAFSFLCLSSPTLGQSPTAARKELNDGVEAFKQARFEDAVTHFRLAVESDPHLLNAHLYLATAYSEQYIPGNDSVDNLRIANQALEQYKIVIESKDPVSSLVQQANSIKGVAGLNLQMKKFGEARQYYKEGVKLDPADPENYYSVGVIDWTESYQPRMEIRVKLNLKPTQSLIHKPECWELKSQNEAVVKDGIEQLTEAIRLRPDYDDAMAYLNLMFRERADIQCGDDKAYNADTTAADSWVDMNLATKKARAEKAAAQKQ
jgi:tetratricopeptide (TPR) repeat protein